MEIKVIQKDEDMTHIALSGRLDVKGVEESELKFIAHTSSRSKSAIVDLSQLEFISSLGLRMLLSNAKTLSNKGAKMILLNPVEEVLNILKISGFDKLLTIVFDYDEARRLLSQS